MSLASYDVKQELIKLTKNFLSIDHPFTELKDLLVNKKPIHLIHNQIAGQLSQIKNLDDLAITSRLEENAYQQQIKEDEEEKRRDIEEMRQDLRQKNKMTDELQSIKALKEQYDRQLLVYTHVHSHPDTPVVHQHPSQPVPVTLLNPNSHVHTHLEASLSRQDLERKIEVINRRILVITREFNTLAFREDEREIRRGNREKRLQARLGYVERKTGVTDTLTSVNRENLISNINRERKAIEQQYSSLLLKAEQLSYSIFLEEFERSLQITRRPSQEIEALRTIVRKMKEHLDYQQKAANIQLQLNRTVQAISENNSTLQQLNSKLVSLRLANPNLTKSNDNLEKENTGLRKLYDNHTKIRNKLIPPALTLSGLSLLFSIPLILTLAGIIPYAIAPAVVFTLVIAPPAILLLAGLGVGIAAITYAVKAYLNKSAIESNRETIENNTKQMSTNRQEIDTLENQTIPTLRQTLLQNEGSQILLTNDLQYAETLAKQALNQAKEVEPYVYSSTPFFKPDVNAQQHPSALGNTITTPSAPPYESLYPTFN
ncbi:type IV secretion protein Dot [Legionella norrlandica]|uniref:Type IV secretion protein Dot n=1 Tax=Legionella norrlandica TaxID=1498499 RepID=A0A0A2SR55_9GAMM|nr:Dot/Icm T4SS effector LegC3/PpeA [Legionella norrlandica]KGP63610.1 type IV secretion protein Dot [Legionella norrlandica]